MMKTIKALIVLVIISFLTSCSGYLPINPTVTRTPIPPTVTATSTITPTATIMPTLTPEPTATPDRYASYTVENLTKIPKSEAEIATSCVEVASPIDDWNQYSKDMDKVLAVFPEIMKDYNGSYIVSDVKEFGVNLESIMFLEGSVLVPVMCVKFDYKGASVVQLTLAAKDKNGPVPLNMILNPEHTYENDFMIESVDRVLRLFPHTVSGKLSGVDGLFTPWSGSNQALNTGFIYDYFSNPNNSGFAQIIWDSWMKNNEFNNQGSKKAIVLSNIQLAHTREGELIKP